MATNPAVDPAPPERAQVVGGERSTQATDTRALTEYIARRDQAKIVESFGTLEWDYSYDYKADRRARDRKLGLID